MKNRSVHLITAIAGTAMATAITTSAAESDLDVPGGIAEAREHDQRMLASVLLPMMPREHRRAIIAAGGVGSEGYAALRDRTGESLVSHDARYERLREFISPALFARIKDEHLGAMLLSRDRAETGELPLALCFAPDTDPELAAAFNALFEEEFWGGGIDDDGNRFQILNRWTSTASAPGTGSQGTPITLTYSFAPDGAIADNLFGQNRPSELFAWFNLIYGTPANWQPLFDQIFIRWSDLIGTSYIYEPNDDGVEANTASGVLGVRGDVRIFAVPLDGTSNVLAFNWFPNSGDMVIDSTDTLYFNTGFNSRLLRNTLAHEHGHGMGFSHVCPIDQTKIMEPTISTAYDGPRLDDILAGQRQYGDPNEHNDNASTATDLGDWPIGRIESVENVSIDDNDDIDFYRITTTEPLDIVVDLEPDADTYNQGPQTDTCGPGVGTNYNTMQDLLISVVDSDGTTTLITVNEEFAGSDENLLFTIETPGEYFIVIDDSSNHNTIQRYRMDIEARQLTIDAPTIAALQNPPSAVLPGAPLLLDFEVLANADTIIAGPDLHYRLNGGAYTVAPLTPLGNDVFQATIPAALCGDTPEFYISVEGDSTGSVTLPPAGLFGPFSYEIGAIVPDFHDDFELPNGWDDTMATASTGLWERGIPVQSPGAPQSDFDGTGQCYVTGNASNDSVNSGRVFLTSPPIDLDDGGHFAYAYWFSSGPDTFDGDTLTVEMSTNGQVTWQTMKTYTTDSAGWQTDSITLDAGQGVSDTRFRFVAYNTGNNNVVEAAIDAISAGPLDCEDPGGCNLADIAEPFDTLDLADIVAFVTAFQAEEPAADLAPPFGTFDLADITQFVIEFSAGCP